MQLLINQNEGNNLETLTNENFKELSEIKVPGFYNQGYVIQGQANTSVKAQVNVSKCLEKFVSFKQELLAEAIQKVFFLVKEREHIRDKHLRQIYEEMRQIRTSLMNLPDTKYQIIYIAEGINRTRGELRKQLTNLSREKRDREVECWRDTLNLKQGINYMIKQLSFDKRRQNLIFEM